MKISIITVCKNSEETILDTFNSVLSQDYENIEHIIVDGKSVDSTIKIINNYHHPNKKVIIENDKGIYDAMNKGIQNSTGEIVCILNSDDIYQNNKVISNVVKAIQQDKNFDIFFTDVVFFKNTNFTKISRKYSVQNFNIKMLNFGFMPPHPGTFIKKKLYDQYGLYSNEYTIAADFDYFFRILKIKKIRFQILNFITVRMRAGGISGRNLKAYFTTTKEILTSINSHLRSKKIFTIIPILLRFPWKALQFINFNEKKINEDYQKFIQRINYKKIDNYFKIIRNHESIPFNKNFILSGMNLAFLGFFAKKDVNYHPDQYHWPDGIFSKTLSRKIIKIPGRDMLSKINLTNNIESITILGNCTSNTKDYLKNKFKREIFHINLPYGTIQEIINYLPINFEKKTLILITIPTPKQEQLAYKISELHQDYKIICIGASLAMLSGEEKIVPKYLQNIEFIWRLRTDTWRRIKRIADSLFYFILGNTLKKDLKNLKFKIIDE